MKQIIIIGSGLAGIAAAIRLQRAGLQAAILEKNGEVGGKLARLSVEGCRFDLGPTVLTMPFILEELFELAGANMNEHLRLLPVEPTCRYRWSDGTVFDARSRSEGFAEEVEKAFPGEGCAAETFLHDAERLYEATKNVFLFSRFEGIREFFRPRNLPLLFSLPSLELSRTMHGSMSRRFRSKKLIQFWDRFATYTGSSPYRASATLNIIPFVELGFGAWYPEGGMYSVVAALEALARSVGVEFRMNQAVDAIVRKGARVVAVRSGEEDFRCDGCITNVDMLWTYRTLLEPSGLVIPPSLERGERSCSGFLLLAKIRGCSPDLAHHNIFFSDDYRSEFVDIFERGTLPSSMTIYISISSRSDPSLASPGCENWYILVNAPPSRVDQPQKDENDRYEEMIWQRLATFGITPAVEWKSRLTPIDFAERSNSVGGALYGNSSNSLFSAFSRSRNTVPGLKNFFAAGGSTHPGGGIPLALLSGKIAAGLCEHELLAER